MARFRITEQPYYREGKLHPVGDEVFIPDTEKPAPHWVPLDPQPAPTAKPVPPGKTKS